MQYLHYEVFSFYEECEIIYIPLLFIYLGVFLLPWLFVLSYLLCFMSNFLFFILSYLYCVKLRDDILSNNKKFFENLPMFFYQNAILFNWSYIE